MKFERKTIFSNDRKFRYALWREFYGVSALPGVDMPVEGNEAQHFVQFIGLNPSTANETENDKTIRRCISFAREWRFGGFCMTNLFPMVTAYRKNLKATNSVENDELLFSTAALAGKIICCWGNFPAAQKTGVVIIQEMLAQKLPVFHLGLNQNGSPKHPLYLPKTTTPLRFVKG